MKQPCLDCGTSTSGTRCPKCSGAYLRARNTKQTGLRKSKGGRPQYSGGWSAYSKAIRATATVCHLCGEGAKADDPWQADHIISAARGGGAGPAAAAHRSCNVGRANRERHRQQTDTPIPHGQGSSRR